MWPSLAKELYDFEHLIFLFQIVQTVNAQSLKTFASKCSGSCFCDQLVPSLLDPSKYPHGEEVTLNLSGYSLLDLVALIFQVVLMTVESFKPVETMLDPLLYQGLDLECEELGFARGFPSLCDTLHDSCFVIHLNA